MARTDHPWTVPIRVEDIPETGRRVELAADESVRATLAEAAGVNALTRLDAVFELSRRGRGGLHVVGAVTATVRQTCVVTLEPISNEVSEEIDLVFAPAGAQATARTEHLMDAGDLPEPIVEGVIDLGAVATEFLILGIDPYPRKPGAVFEAPQSAGRETTPFAALSALKKSDGGSES
jgi:uncharacterized metal-binding protein YceD (DUF177 family)